MKRGRKKYQYEKDIDPKENIGFNLRHARFGLYANHPWLGFIRAETSGLWDIPQEFSFTPAQRRQFAKARRENRKRFSTAVTQALLKKDATFFQDIAEILRCLTILDSSGAASPRLAALGEAHFTLALRGILPTRDQVVELATHWLPSLPQDKKRLVVYFKKLGLKFSLSEKRRGPAVHHS